MVYQIANQTQQYPRIQSHYKTTKEHFHDKPNDLEPHKTSTVGKLYANSLYFMEKRLEKAPPKATDSELSKTLTMSATATTMTKRGGKTYTAPYTWSGRLPSCYEGNGTFRLANNLTYSVKPVKLTSYAGLSFKSEYQDQYWKKPSTTGYGYGYGKDGYSTLRTSRGF